MAPKTSLKIRIMQNTCTLTPPLTPSDEMERDDIIKSTQLSLVEAKTAKVYGGQQNVSVVEKRILEEDVEKIVKGDDESSGSEFAETMLLSYGNSGDRIDTGSHKENLEEIVNDDEKKDDKHDDAKIDENMDDDDDYHNDQEIVPNLAKHVTDDLIKDNLPRLVRCLRKHDHDNHPSDDAHQDGEKSAKMHKTFRSSKFARGSSSKQPSKESNTSVYEQLQQQDFVAWVDIPVNNEDEVTSKDETHELLMSFRMLIKDLKENMIRWVRKEFKTFNEESWFSIQHWKDSWHKRMYKFKHKKGRADQEKVFSNNRIVEVVRVTMEKQ
nr:hypothetical protein [Tanacetum cinerariifolium]